MPPLSAIQLAIDSGLLVLIWIVQVIVYPNFNYIPNSSFKSAHQKYTRTMGYIAAPLMIAQLGAATLALLNDPQSILTLRHFTLIVVTWLVTFMVSVRLHNKLQTDGKNPDTLRMLVSTNWIRTSIWTLIFILSFSNALHK